MTDWSASHVSEPSRAEMWRWEIRLAKQILPQLITLHAHGIRLKDRNSD
jgi:hypothetical protein